MSTKRSMTLLIMKLEMRMLRAYFYFVPFNQEMPGSTFVDNKVYLLRASAKGLMNHVTRNRVG